VWALLEPCDSDRSYEPMPSIALFVLGYCVYSGFSSPMSITLNCCGPLCTSLSQELNHVGPDCTSPYSTAACYHEPFRLHRIFFVVRAELLFRTHRESCGATPHTVLVTSLLTGIDLEKDSEQSVNDVPVFFRLNKELFLQPIGVRLTRS